MIVQHQPPLHLTYCLNIHPGESWAENLAAIREHAVAVKHRVAPEEWFGLGLRIAQRAAEELTADEALRAEALEVFAQHRLYPFSINGFPYGRFHSGSIKENVYAPDWRTPERLNYSLQLIDLLGAWMPAEVRGTISTVPLSFKTWITREEEVTAMAENLASVVAYLDALRTDTGRQIQLSLEPEPDCFLETTAETIAFFKEVMFRRGASALAQNFKRDRVHSEELIRRHLGVCFDTCHLAMQGEDLAASLRAYRAEGIRVGKVQLSAAVRARSNADTREALRAFVEPVYLHQVKGRGRSGARFAWFDLPKALDELPSFPDVEEVFVHFHVPLFWAGNADLQSTASALTPEFFHELRVGNCPQLEIETYTFNVLPPEVHPGDVVKSIAHEYSWVLGKLH